jgi:Amt family ammonium transporter
VISIVIPLRMSPEVLEIGDDAIHGEEAYALYGEGDRNPSYVAGGGGE